MAKKLSEQILLKIAKTKSGTPFMSLMKEVGLIVKTSVQGFGRLGKNANKVTHHPPLKPITVDYHKYLDKAKNTCGFYKKDGKKHFVISGQFFDSIQSFEDANTSTVTVKPTGERWAYRNLEGKPMGVPPTNEEIGGYLSKRWPIFFVSNTVKKRIVNLVRSYYRRYLTK